MNAYFNIAISCFCLLLIAGTGCGNHADLPYELQAKTGEHFLLKGVTGLTQVAQLTGADSINKTDAANLYGTDLGSMFNSDDKTYLVFGDSFGRRAVSQIGGGGSDWRSNTMAVTTDRDPSDGLKFDKIIADRAGNAKELLPSLKQDNQEMTKIPTNGISVGGSLYLFYMSVKHWGEPGHWDANESGLAKSTDGGQNWSIVSNVKWPGDSNFIQVSAFKVKVRDDLNEIYLWSIPSGRFGNVKLMKVNEKNIENLAKYQYFTGTDSDGSPIWSSDIHQAADVVKDKVGELSVVWNPYLKRWLMTYLQGTGSVFIREGLSPWGPWGDAIELTSQSQYPGLYGPFMNPKYVENGGKTIYFTLSRWEPYNVFWMKVNLLKNE